MLSGKKVVKNTIWIIAGQVYTAVFNFVLNIFTANYLGPSNFGIIGYITSFVNFFISLGGLGLGNVLMKEILANENKEGAVVGSALVLQIFPLIVSYLLTILCVHLFNVGDKVMLICAVLLGAQILFNICNNFQYYFQAKLQSKYISIITMIAYTIMQLYKIYLLVSGKSVEWFAAAQSIDVLVVAILTAGMYFIKKSPKLSFSKDICKKLLKQGIPFMIMGTIGILYSTVDKLMLKNMLNSTAEVGIYNLAFGISHVWSFVASAIIVSFSTMVYDAIKTYGETSKEYKVKMRQLYFIVFWSCFIIAVIVCIALPIFINIAYTEEYKASIVPGIILTWAALFAFMGSAKSVQFISEGKQKYGIIFSILTVIINITLNYFLIPRYQSVGAAIATLLSESFICVLSPLLIKNTRNITSTLVLGVIGKGVDLKGIVQMFKVKFKRKSNSKDGTNIDNNNQNDTENEVEKIELENIENNIEDINQESKINTDEKKINNIENLDNKDKEENNNKEGIIDNKNNK